MKRNYTLLAILLSANILTAQNAIQYDTFFNNGEFNFISEASNDNVDHGAIGENVEWIFEHLIEEKHAAGWFGEAVEPIQSMNPEYFDGADLCLRTEGGVNKFWQHNESGLSYLGYETETSLLVLSDPLVHMPYPFVLGQKHSDLGMGDLYGTCSDAKWVCDLEAEVVGVGILHLPNATFEKAFKVKRDVSIVKTSLKTGKDKIYSSTEYLWYVNGVSGPVLEIKNWERDICYGPTQGKEVNFSTLIREKGISIGDVFEINVFPNPAKGNSTLSIKSDKDTLVKLFVRDVAGKEMTNMKFITIAKGETIESLDLKGFNPGVYMIEIADGSKKYNHKLVVE